MNDCRAIDRRDFLKFTGLSSAGLIFGMRLGAQEDSADRLAPDLFVSLESDGTIHIVAHRSEMGTGIRSVLPMVVADELGARWEDVRIVQATGDAKYGSQNTDGSRSIWRFYDRMLLAGATAGQMLSQAAATRWGVGPETCQRRDSQVIHEPSKRRIAFKELIAEAAALPVPNAENLVYKDPKDRQYIGKGGALVDFKDIVHGKAVFGADIRLPDMLFAVIDRSPVHGGTARQFDATAAMAVPGVQSVETIAPFKGVHAFQALGGVAVLATHSHAAIQGRNQLQTQWNASPHDGYDSEAYRSALLETASKGGKVVRQKGDYAKAIERLKKHEASYYVPHLLHEPMEPPVATADYRDGQCLIWAPTQNPQAAQSTVAAALGIPPEKVIVRVTLLGGGFGRKSKPDYVAEAAILSKQAGRPVQVLWTREDDIRHDYFHSVAAVRVEAGVDDDGYPQAWRMCTVFPSINSTFAEKVTHASAGEMSMGFNDLPFDIPHLLCENGEALAHVRIGWLRSVANIQHAFAIHSFIDELAVAAGIDPLTYLNRVLGPDRLLDLKAEGADYQNYGGPYATYPVDTARLKAVLNAAAKSAGWGQPMPKGVGHGIAVHRSFLSYIAIALRVRVTDGKVQVEQADVAIDCGLAVHPDRVQSQMEGSVVFGLSLAMMGGVTMSRGQVNESNFHDAPVARIADANMPIRVTILPSQAPPGGVGEPGVPPLAPALCNAIAAATGKRIRSLPIADHDLSQA